VPINSKQDPKVAIIGIYLIVDPISLNVCPTFMLLLIVELIEESNFYYFGFYSF